MRAPGLAGWPDIQFPSFHEIFDYPLIILGQDEVSITKRQFIGLIDISAQRSTGAWNWAAHPGRGVSRLGRHDH